MRVTGTLSKPNTKVAGKAKTFGKALLPFFNPAFLLVTAEAGTGEVNPCLAAIAGGDSAGEATKKRRSLLSGFLKRLTIRGSRPNAETVEAN